MHRTERLDGPVTIERARGKRWAVFGELNPPEPSGAPHPNGPWPQHRRPSS